jgi:hypothetical protein
VQTIPGRHWFCYVRFYGPLEPYFDRSWKLGDIHPGIWLEPPRPRRGLQLRGRSRESYRGSSAWGGAMMLMVGK